MKVHQIRKSTVVMAFGILCLSLLKAGGAFAACPTYRMQLDAYGLHVLKGRATTLSTQDRLMIVPDGSKLRIADSTGGTVDQFSCTSTVVRPSGIIEARNKNGFFTYDPVLGNGSWAHYGKGGVSATGLCQPGCLGK